MEEIKNISDPKIKILLSGYVESYLKLAQEYISIYSDRPDKMLTDENYRLKDRISISAKFEDLLRRNYQQLDSYQAESIENRLICCRLSAMMDVLSYQCSRYQRVYNPKSEEDVIDSAKRVAEIEKYKTFDERKVVILKQMREDLDYNYLQELNNEINRIRALSPEEQQQELMEYCTSTAELKALEGCSISEDRNTITAGTTARNPRIR